MKNLFYLAEVEEKDESPSVERRENHFTRIEKST